MRSLVAGMLVLCALGMVPVAPAVHAEQTDANGCKDHPLFTRMPTYWIHHCSVKEYDAHAFTVATGRKESVEGRTWSASYYPQATATSKPSALQIVRNFENAVRALGGTELWGTPNAATFRIVKDGRETWVDLTTDFTSKYGLTIVERAGMAQSIEVNAGALANDLKATVVRGKLQLQRARVLSPRLLQP